MQAVRPGASPAFHTAPEVNHGDSCFCRPTQTDSANTMIYEICTQTDAGLMRDNNEDALAFDAATRLCILADGMGGYNAGEVASGMAVAFVKSELLRWLSAPGQGANPAHISRGIGLCIERANQSILNAAGSNPYYAGMGT